MKFCVLVTVAFDIFIKQKKKPFISSLDFSFVIFLCKKCLLGQTKRRGTLLTIFRPPRYFNSPAYYMLHKLPTPPPPLLIRTRLFIRDLRVINMLNKSGPNIEPWRTSDNRIWKILRILLILTFCLRLFKPACLFGT